ncbi:MAG: enoyl-ACP reductase [Meiothermus sp.]|uniref:enoyl-ACP reductase FabI n=1 Tax=Meiothermus sp. TaxID=1955249 RepID=UPI0025D96397|nr:enoyl-ACP reductase [Meiothermus sp.]MCS7195274.1 enoyl-ACP reductase [Meiothermus sp.]MCX7741532.1 enoyl-ACP reductase [Meiothermus sp.]MDW8089991.1 enoyl-ACP reductase [Meiothermus sp.]
MVAIDLTGKRALVMGVTNEHSLGWAIAQKLRAAGAEVAFSYQGERLREKLEKLTADYPNRRLYQVDVTDEAALKAMFADLAAAWGGLDCLVHSIAFAPRAAMEGRFIDTTAADWNTALQVSAYSLVAVAREAEPLLREGASLVTLTYYASEKVVPRYNVMGIAKAALEASVRYLAYELGRKNIRVNAISAGAVRTVAAMSIPGFRKMVAKYSSTAPLGRMITHEEVGNLGLYLLSPLSSGTTGQTIYVDAGYSIMGMSFEEEGS